MEGAVSKDTQPHETGHTETLCLQMGICESLLECSRKPNSAKLYDKRETRTSRILQSIRQVRVPALMRLNRRIGNPSYGGVRGRGYRPLPTRFIRVHLYRIYSKPYADIGYGLILQYWVFAYFVRVA